MVDCDGICDSVCDSACESVRDAIEDACCKCDCVRCIGYCVITAGITMFVWGIVLLASHSNRSDQVAAYNAAIGSFNTSVTDGWTGKLISINDVVLLTQSIFPIAVSGNTDGISTGKSSIMQATLASTPNNITVTLNVLANSIVRSPQWQTSDTVFLGCTKSYCTSSCGSNSSSNYYCNSQSMGSMCSNIYGGTWMGNGCTGTSTSCGSCVSNQYLQSYCVVVTQLSNGLYAESSEYQSCEYPFTASSQRFATTPPVGVPFQVYTDKDPYLVLQQQTKGSNTFDSSSKTTGIALVAVGSIIPVGAFIAGLVGLYFLIQQRRKSRSSIWAPEALSVPMLPQFVPQPNTNCQPVTWGPPQDGVWIPHQQQVYSQAACGSQQVQAYSPSEEQDRAPIQEQSCKPYVQPQQTYSAPSGPELLVKPPVELNKML